MVIIMKDKKFIVFKEWLKQNEIRFADPYSSQELLDSSEVFEDFEGDYNEIKKQEAFRLILISEISSFADISEDEQMLNMLVDNICQKAKEKCLFENW